MTLVLFQHLIILGKQETFVRHFAAKAAFLVDFLWWGFAPPQKIHFIPGL